MKQIGGLMLALLAGLIQPLWAADRAATAPAAPVEPVPTVVVRLDGQVDNHARDQLYRRFAEARRLGARTIVLEIDTYGGLVTAGLEISQFLKRQDDLRIIAYVPEKAISAGVMIALAADEIVMGPSAKMGDSAPISITPGTGMQPMPATERAKAESPILEDFYESAIKNGYDPLLTESMVAVGRTVYWIQNADGQRRFVDADTFAQLTADGAWRAVPGVRSPIDAADTLLTVHADLAVTLGLARGVEPSLTALATDRNLHIIRTLGNSAGDHLIAWLGGSAARFVLFTVFMMALYIALHAPGHGGAEVVAVVSLALLVGVPLLTGYAQWWEIVAILLGLVLLAVEVFLIPGFGITGISGIVLVLFGFVMTFVPKEPGGRPGILPSLDATWHGLQTGVLVIFGGLACSAFLWFWLNRYLPRLPYFNRLILTAGSSDAAAIPAPDAPAAFPVPGMVGRAATDLRPGGTIELYDDAAGIARLLDAVSDSGFVPAASKVIVRELRGGYIVVRALEPTP